MIIRVETVVDDDPMDHFVMIKGDNDIRTYREKYSEILDDWYAKIPDCWGHHNMILKFIETLQNYNIDAEDVAYLIEDVVIGFKRNE